MPVRIERIVGGVAYVNEIAYTVRFFHHLPARH